MLMTSTSKDQMASSGFSGHIKSCTDQHTCTCTLVHTRVHAHTHTHTRNLKRYMLGEIVGLEAGQGALNAIV